MDSINIQNQDTTQPKTLEAKDMFSFDGQSQIYAKVRPVYPDLFYSQLEKYLIEQEKPKNYRVCLDIGTGTGQIARKLAPKFEHIYGLDISEKQLEQARTENKDLSNLSFHLCDVYDIEKFVNDNELKGKVDLIIMGEVFHWFDPVKALEIIHQVASQSNALVVIWAYFQFSFIHQSAEKDVFDVNLEYLRSFNEVQFDKEEIQDENLQKLYQSYNTSLYKFDALAVPYYAFDVTGVLGKFYTTIDFDSKYFDFVNKTCVIQNLHTSAQHALDFLHSTSGYRVLLERNGIQIGDKVRDPAEIFKQEIIETYKNYKKTKDEDLKIEVELKDIETLIGWPFFSIVLKVK
eukprot:403333497